MKLMGSRTRLLQVAAEGMLAQGMLAEVWT